MKSYISINSVEELEREALNAIEIYEDRPEDPDPDEEDVDEDNDELFMDDPGDVVLETDELEIEADFPLDEFPGVLSFSVDLLSREEDEDLSPIRNLDSKHVAEVTITLKEKWTDSAGKSMALYDVDLD
jgi:hypothetical protein